MGHRYLLAFARWALLALLAAGTANATVYNLCNKGKVEVKFATALRSGSSFFGYSWHLDGWYAIPPGKCEDAYLHKSDSDPDEPIYVALAFTDSTGVWGAATFDKPKVDTKLCVGMDSFEYPLNGNINLPCKSGYFPFPAALYLEPVAWGCSDKYPGQPINCWGRYYKFEFELDNDSRAIAAGPSNGKRVAPTGSGPGASSTSGSSSLTIGEILAGAAIVAGVAALLSTDSPKPFERGTLNASLLGKKIVRYSSSDSDWYYEDGSHVNPAWGLNGKTASWLMDAPDQHPTSDPEVVAAFGSLRQALASSQYNRRTEIEPTGRLSYSYIPYDGPSEYSTTVNLSALDYKNAQPVVTDGRGVTGFMIPCKQLQLCVGVLYEGKVKTKDKFYLLYIGEGDAKAETVWSPLMKLVNLYPAEPAIAVR